MPGENESVGDMMGDDAQFQEFDESEFEGFEDLDMTQGSGGSWTDKIRDTILEDTSHKNLDDYDLDDYSFLPDSQGSKRLLRAADVAFKHLETVLSDVIIGVYQISRDMNTATGGE